MTAKHDNANEWVPHGTDVFGCGPKKIALMYIIETLICKIHLLIERGSHLAGSR